MIRRLAGRLLGRSAPLLPDPDSPLVAIGDVHGCHGQLCELLERTAGWMEDRTQLVFLGDLVDRGPHSAAVLDLAMEITALRPGRSEALMGNHERMMLDFLAGKERSDRWLAHGGADTLASFGLAVPPAEELAEPGTVEALAAAAREAVGGARIEWLSSRPLFVQNGDVIAVHAAWSARRSAERQDPELLIWGHPDFYRHKRREPPWIVHGHVVTRPARAEGTRIAVDSGAYLGGGLTAVRLAPGAPPEFRCAGGPDQDLPAPR
ncbi:metallophosphoesterase family protein [Mangrovicoccus sp. HB161399]|uniref:metallophosphoesterase family protein n=1 Tax=Mangrovicoccus sp. HB161399 TaxID=2720392 RepID=UPI001553FFF0|nr:metallophosphoesterase family protein [Mangrovicoccus sp. HB161399]